MSTSIGGIDPAKQAFSLFDEFKNFAFKGNVIDMAVGVIIGSAFGKIVTSMVENVFMPFITAVFSGGKSEAVKDGKPVAIAWFDKLVFQYGDMSIPYGKFLGEIITFLILALVLFIFIVKFMGWILNSKKAAASAAATPPADVALLTEIRDLLKAKV